MTTRKDSATVAIEHDPTILTKSITELEKNSRGYTAEQMTELNSIIHVIATPELNQKLPNDIIDYVNIATFKILLNQNVDEQQAEIVLTALAKNENFLSWFDQLPNNEINSYFSTLLTRYPDKLYQFLAMRYPDKLFDSIKILPSLSDEVKVRLAELYVKKGDNVDALQFLLNRADNQNIQMIWTLFIKYRDKGLTLEDYMADEEDRDKLFDKITEAAKVNTEFSVTVLSDNWQSKGLTETQAMNIFIKHMNEPEFIVDKLHQKGVESIYEALLKNNIGSIRALYALQNIKDNFKQYLISGNGNNAIYQAATHSLSSFLHLLQLSERFPELKQVTTTIEDNIAQYFKERGSLDFHAIASQGQIKIGNVRIPITTDVVTKLAELLANKGNASAQEYLSSSSAQPKPPISNNEKETADVIADITRLENMKTIISTDDLILLKNHKLQAMAHGNTEAVQVIDRFLNTHLTIKAQINSLVISDHQTLIDKRLQEAASRNGAVRLSTQAKASAKVTGEIVEEKSLINLHHKIQLDDLDEDGFFVPKAKRAEAIARFKNGQVPTEGPYKDRISASEFGFTIIKLKNVDDGKDHIYGVYAGEHALGAGTFGKVKLIQDLETGDLDTIKIQKLHGVQYEALTQFRREYRLLKKTNQAASQMVIREVATNETRINKMNNEEKTETAQAIFAMKLARGEDLHQCMCREARNQYDATSPMCWLRLPQSVIAGYTEDIASKGLVHRDIKPANMIFNRGVVKTIDLGGAEVTGKAIRDLVTTFAFWAPELRKAYYMNQPQLHDERSEVFSLGKTIAWVMGFAAYSNKIDAGDLTSKDYHDFMVNSVELINLYSKDDPRLAWAKCPPELRGVMIDFLARMTHIDPAKRPSLLESHKFFEQIAEYQLTAVEKVRKVAIFDVNEYLSNPNQQEDMRKALRQADTVYLADLGNTHRSQLAYLKVIADLEDDNIIVERKLYSPTSSTASKVELLDAIKDKIQASSPQHVHSFVHVTTDENHSQKESLEHHQIGVIVSAHIKEESDYRTELHDFTKKQLLTAAQFDLLITALQSDRDRLIDKYGNSNTEVTKRVDAINATIENFENQVVTYAHAHSELDKLQHKIISLSNIEKNFENWLPKDTTEIISRVQELKEKLQSPSNDSHLRY